MLLEIQDGSWYYRFDILRILNYGINYVQECIVVFYLEAPIMLDHFSYK